MTHVESLRVADTDASVHRNPAPLMFWQYEPQIYVYQASAFAISFLKHSTRVQLFQPWLFVTGQVQNIIACTLFGFGCATLEFLLVPLLQNFFPFIHNYVFCLHSNIRLLRPFAQVSEEGCCEDDEEGEEGVPSCREWYLPARDFEGQWEALYYDISIKKKLVKYATTALLFADRGVDDQLVSWNR